MTTYVWRDGALIERDLAPPLVDYRSMSDLPSPHFISDTMPDTQHVADGKWFSSKSAFRKNTKAHGCIEVGSTSKDFGRRKFVPKLDKRKRRDDIGKAVHDLRNGKAKA